MNAFNLAPAFMETHEYPDDLILFKVTMTTNLTDTNGCFSKIINQDIKFIVVITLNS